LSDIRVKLHQSKHAHAHYNWVENNVIEVEATDLHLVHLGDIAADAKVLSLISKFKTKIDYLVIPYWLLAKSDLVRELESNSLVSKIVISHVPEAYDQRIIKMVEEFESGKVFFK